MGILDNISTVKPSDGGNYLPTGTALVRVSSCKTGRSDTSGEFFASDTIVVMPLSEDYKLKPGEEGAFFRGFSRYRDSALGDVRGFLHACAQSQLHEEIGLEVIDEEFSYAAVSEEQPLEGTLLRVYGWQKPGKTFTKYRFTVPTQDELRSAIEAGHLELGEDELALYPEE